MGVRQDRESVVSGAPAAHAKRDQIHLRPQSCAMPASPFDRAPHQ
jgi:hypothetical protein